MKSGQTTQQSVGISFVEASGYRCLRHVSQPLRPFQLLVGPNASGKSTFLDAIGFLSDLLKTDLDTAVRGDARLEVPHRAPDPQHLTWQRSGKAFELAVEMGVPPEGRSQPKDEACKVRYEVRIEVGDPPRIATENLWLISGSAVSPLEAKKGMVDSERLVQHAQQLVKTGGSSVPFVPVVMPPKSRTPAGWKRVLWRSQAENQVYFRAETGQWTTPFAVSPQRGALASLPEDPGRFPASTRLREILLHGVRRVTLDSKAMRMPAPPTRQSGYLPDGSNLPYVVARLQESDPGRFRDWINHVREALPDIDAVTTAERPEDRHRYLILHYRTGLRAPSWLVSDGTLRLLALTLLAYSPDVDHGVYLIEEPENGIHPRAIETVFQSLSSVYRAQVLLATHSPAILSMAELDDLLCFSRDPDGAALVVAGRAHRALKDWKGAFNLADLHAMGVLG